MSLTPRTARPNVLKSLALLGFAAGLLTAFAPASQAGPLEQEMLKNAPQLMKNLRDKGYKNVGVLKFRVRKGNADPSDSVGTLNTTLANRTEMALVLVNDPAEDKQVGIIQDASSVAAKVNGASHMSKDGRQVLFSTKYPLAWGKESVNPDAFVIGQAVIGADLKEMQVVMGIIDKEAGSRPVDRAVSFTVPVESELLSEMGESFLVRGLFTVTKDTKVDPTKAVAYATKFKAKEELYPLDDKNDAPVLLEIWYGKSKVPFAIQDGKAAIRSPLPNEKVVLRIVRKKPGRYGVVLKVNGENTIFQQKGPDLRCYKWILEPNMDKIDIHGYAVKGEAAWRQFRVLSPAASKGFEVYYGHDVGTYSMTVYAEQPQGYKEENKDENYAALAAGFYPEDKPDTLAGLQHSLREYGSEAGSQNQVRGLVVAGEKIGGGGTREVPFKAFPSPILSATIAYHQVK